MDTMDTIIPPGRGKTLRYFVENGPCSVAQAKVGLSRDYKNVHDDVTKLEKNGFLERDNDTKRLRRATSEGLIRSFKFEADPSNWMGHAQSETFKRFPGSEKDERLLDLMKKSNEWMSLLRGI